MDTYVKYYHATIENRVSVFDSILDSRFSRGLRIECQLTLERYCITKLGLAEGEDTSKSFKVLFISLAQPQTENDSDAKPRVAFALPWVPEVFLACGGNFRCWPKAFRVGHYKDLTETGNRARKVSGTQGTLAFETLSK